MSKVHDVLLRHKRIDQKQYDVLIAREAAKVQAKAAYKKDKAKMNKAELMAVLDTLTN